MSYSYQQSSSHWVPGAILMLLLVAIPIAMFFKLYLRIAFYICFGLVAATMSMAFAATENRIKMLKLQGNWSHDGPMEIILPVSCFLFYLLTAALVARLFRAWFFNDLRDGQERSGSEGAKAWFSWGNTLCVIGLSITGAYAFGYSIFALGIIGVLALLARPVLTGGVSELGVAEKSAFESGSETERERILRLLEEGKIDADGAADLLNALGAAGETDMKKEATTMSSKQKLALAGGVLILIGFLLPWFSISFAEEMSLMTGSLNQQVRQTLPQIPSGRPVNSMSPILSPITGSLNVSGAEINKGLGWIVLLCGIAAAGIAAMPQLVDDQTVRRNLLLVSLGIGAAILFYLFGSSLRHVTYGIVVVVVGYGCVGAGAVETLRKRN